MEQRGDEAWWNKMWGWQLLAYVKVLRALEADLLEQHELPITWFDVMNRLWAAPGQRLRIGELEEASLFTSSGITRLVDRIEAAGFVRRERSAEDRRGVYVVMTQAGNDKLNEVRPDHVASVYQHFGSHLDREDGEAVEIAAKKILGDDPVVSELLAYFDHVAIDPPSSEVAESP